MPRTAGGQPDFTRPGGAGAIANSTDIYKHRSVLFTTSTPLPRFGFAYSSKAVVMKQAQNCTSYLSSAALTAAQRRLPARVVHAHEICVIATAIWLALGYRPKPR